MRSIIEHDGLLDEVLGGPEDPGDLGEGAPLALVHPLLELDPLPHPQLGHRDRGGERYMFYIFHI